MDFETAIRCRDDRACMVTVARPGGGDLLYGIVTPHDGIRRSVAEGLRDARRLFEMEPWADDKPR
jgi:hypothetical protein